MTTRQFVRARLDMVRGDLNRFLDHMPEKLYLWAPEPSMRTVQGQLIEIVLKEVEMLDHAKKGGEEEWVEVEDLGGRDRTLASMRAYLAEVREGTLAFLDSLSEEELASPVKFPTNWWEGLGLPELPMSEVLRSIAMHEWYHTGQLYAYVWYQGLDPSDW
jgi:uncharacterized damage-inducible protein DinB